MKKTDSQYLKFSTDRFTKNYKIIVKNCKNTIDNL